MGYSTISVLSTTDLTESGLNIRIFICCFPRKLLVHRFNNDFGDSGSLPSSTLPSSAGWLTTPEFPVDFNSYKHPHRTASKMEGK